MISRFCHYSVFCSLKGIISEHSYTSSFGFGILPVILSRSDLSTPPSARLALLYVQIVCVTLCAITVSQQGTTRCFNPWESVEYHISTLTRNSRLFVTRTSCRTSTLLPTGSPNVLHSPRIAVHATEFRTWRHADIWPKLCDCRWLLQTSRNIRISLAVEHNRFETSAPTRAALWTRSRILRRVDAMSQLAIVSFWKNARIR